MKTNQLLVLPSFSLFLSTSNDIFIQEARLVTTENFIIGGSDVPRRGMYPWFVSLTHTADTSVDPTPFCGGQLISPTFVLTAAHCVFNAPPPSSDGMVRDADKYTVFVGSFKRPLREDSRAEEFTITRIIPHPMWDGQIGFINGFDMALLELKGTSKKKPVKPDLFGISETFRSKQASMIHDMSIFILHFFFIVDSYFYFLRFGKKLDGDEAWAIGKEEHYISF